jgi:lipoic acid synthetase
MSGRLPAWFKQKLPDAQAMHHMTALLDKSRLHTICESALCPNAGECFSMKTATFLILGNVCTRGCGFCAVARGIPLAVDSGEAARVVTAAAALSLRYVVTTSVTRDDLPDGGASQFALVIERLHGHREGIAAEVLVPDFGGSAAAVEIVVAAAPEVVGHNVETVPRLYSEVRPGARYDRSLRLLSDVKRLNQGVVTKSGLMVGFGETESEVIRVMQDLHDAGCDIVTVGQYLQPSPQHHPVLRYLDPEEFARYGRAARNMGFAGVASSPLVRSSYQAASLYAGTRQPVNHALAAGHPSGRSGVGDSSRTGPADPVLNAVRGDAPR